MFSRLKEKLRVSLHAFSRKTEEQAEEMKTESLAVEGTTVEEIEPKEEEKKESKEEALRVGAELVAEESGTLREDGSEAKEEEPEEVESGEKSFFSRLKEKLSFRKAGVEEEAEKKKEIKEKEETAEKFPAAFSETEAEELLEQVLEEKEKVPKEQFSEKKKKESKSKVKTKIEPEPVTEPKITIITKIPEDAEAIIVESKPEAEELQEEKKSFLKKIKETFTTKIISAEKFADLFWDLEFALLENNVSVEVIEKIKEDLKEELVDKPLPRDVLKKIQETLKKTLLEILSMKDPNLLKLISKKKPFVIAFFGVNGAGKTTSIAKLTDYLQKNDLSVVLAACDTFRAAAIQQLEEHAHKLRVKTIKHDYGSDAAAVAYDAIKYAEKNEIDVVLIDTAGRLHSNTNLMAELGKIIRVAKPDFKIFVGESITGNDCVEQARKFKELVEMDGIMLTKADVDEKGGASLSIAYTIKKPILFLGVGQGYEDLEKFNPRVMLERLGFEVN